MYKLNVDILLNIQVRKKCQVINTKLLFVNVHIKKLTFLIYYLTN
jgi:hypothetical protein